jgi:hypothetical protein
MSKLLSDNRFDLRIRDCKFGRGVFAGTDFAVGALIEVCPVLLLNQHESHMAWAAHAGILERYYFDYDEKHAAIALGYGSLYNHSRSPNADYSSNTSSKEIVIFALKKIKKGNQILINYGYDPAKR